MNIARIIPTSVACTPDLHIALIEASDCLEQMTECLLGQGDQPNDAVQTMQVILDWANYIDEFGAPKDTVEQQISSVNNEPLIDASSPELKQKDTKAKPAQDVSLRVPANIIDELINQSGESIIATSQMQENVNKLLASMRDIKSNKDDVYTLSQQLEHLIDVHGTDNKFSSVNKNEKFDLLELDQYNELHTYSRRLIEATADSVELIKDLEEKLFSLESVIADQTRAQKDNQYAILKTRMMPVESVVARLKQGVRQVAKISGKSVQLDVLGVDILLDSKILNNLVDPLMHLLRNSVDHGIESNEVR
jgi:chemotaxis protein histidine kinase CheA